MRSASAQPEDYKRIAGWLRVKRGDREQYIEDVKRDLRRELDAAGITGEITGRPKHIYSIWRKMQRKSLQFEQVMDVLAVRVMVGTIADCYAALGIVHGLWPYIPGEFDDYIATPKDNNYRSLHTAVIGPGKLPLEVQIRTHEMHAHAELGVAAHWQYKEGRKAESSFQQKIVWLRQLLEPAQRDGAEPDLLANLQAEVFEDRLYALSPRGEVIDLPKGATPARLRLSRTHGPRASLPRRPRERPHGAAEPSSREWRHRRDHPGKTAASQPRLARAAARLPGVGRQSREGTGLVPEAGRGCRTATRAGRCSSASSTGSGCALPPFPSCSRSRSCRAWNALSRVLARASSRSHRWPARSIDASHGARAATNAACCRPRRRRSVLAGGMVVDGVGDLMSSTSHAAAGRYRRKKSSVSSRWDAGSAFTGPVAPTSCACAMRIRSGFWPWTGAASSPERTFPVAVLIDAFDRRGLVRDISGVLADEHINIEAMNTTTNAAENTARVDVTVKVHGLDELSRLLSRFSALPNVISARRRG